MRQILTNILLALGTVISTAVPSLERWPVRKKRLLTVVRRKVIWIPLSFLLIVAGSLWGTNYYLMKAEAVVWEIGQSLRGRLDDFSHDYLEGEPQVIASYYTDEFNGSELGFDNRQRISEEGGIVLEEWKTSKDVRLNGQQMLDQLLSYRAHLHNAEVTKFKMVHLNEYTETRANILMRFQIYAHDEQGHSIEDRGHFNVDLVRHDGEWKIAKQELINGRRVIGLDSRYFVDVTNQVGIDFNTGVNPIFKHLKYTFALAGKVAGGVTSGDYDRDGYPDLFLAGAEESKLYRNTGQGTFEDVTGSAFPAHLVSSDVIKYAQGCVFVDYNNDGYLDVFITKTPKVTKPFFLDDWPLKSADELLVFINASSKNAEKAAGLFETSQEKLFTMLKQTPEKLPQWVEELAERWRFRLSNRLLKNNGDGTFTDVTKEAGLEYNGYCTTAAFADINNDGHLDLYFGDPGPAKQQAPDPPFHARNGLPNRLYRNNGNGTFTDITEEAKVGDTGWTLGVTFWDYDNDGDQDIYIADDFGPNSLYQNDGTGHFKEVARETGTLDYGSGMSASPGDYDNDGDLDMYVSNLYSGTTWYLQHNIMQFLWVRFIDPSRTWRSLKVAVEAYHNLGSLDGIKAIGKKFGEGNSLLENQGDGTFKSVGVEKGVNMAGWAWGSNFFDFDNDGDLDIHSVNGWISQKKGTDL
ncbi:VCBS repeat-containing protein [Candidatus Poribacteria bacterium]|nr:VCBS repeat-containing protein [Candidatus Poribacteria bacterium]